MRKFVLFCVSFCTLALLLSASPLKAQNIYWVASNGSNSNACTLAAPCAAIQVAINQGNAAQVNCKDSGEYGSFTITASIIIDCGTGNVGHIGAFNTNGITINASSSATIILRHLEVHSFDGNGSGITTTAFPSGTLIVEDCTISQFTGPGILFSPTAGRGLLQVSNSQIFGNAQGISVQPGSGQIASLALEHVQSTGNTGNGLVLGGGVVAGTVRESFIAANGQDGVLSSAAAVFFTVEESSIIANLANGIHTSSAGSSIKVGASTIGANGTGVLASSGSLVSFGNNQMSDNASNGNFTSTIALR